MESVLEVGWNNWSRWRAYAFVADSTQVSVSTPATAWPDCVWIGFERRNLPFLKFCQHGKAKNPLPARMNGLDQWSSHDHVHTTGPRRPVFSDAEQIRCVTFTLWKSAGPLSLFFCKIHAVHWMQDEISVGEGLFWTVADAAHLNFYSAVHQILRTLFPRVPCINLENRHAYGRFSLLSSLNGLDQQYGDDGGPPDVNRSSPANAKTDVSIFVKEARSNRV